MKLSIVTTLYHSEKYVQEFYDRISSVAKQIVSDDYEIILVDDGSPDKSLEIAVSLTTDPKVKVIELSRNFGHHKAIMTGLKYAKGDLVFLIDSDLEEEPEWLISFYNQMNDQKCDVVFGVQEKRKGGWFERISGPWFYWLLNKLAEFQMNANIVTARLMKKRYVQSLTLFQEREILIAGLWHITGFDQKPLHVIKKSHSPTTYSLRSKLSLIVNAITNFSATPLIMICGFGLFICMISFLGCAYLILSKLLFATPLSGWTSVIASIWLLGGMIIFFLGVIGIYISKIFTEVKQRPYTIIKNMYGTFL